MPPRSQAIPATPVSRLLTPVNRFLEIEAASGVILLACTAAALALANSPWAHSFADFWHTPIELTAGSWRISGTLGHLVINDGLMTIFFFVVGLEIKRELVAGELAETRKALLPVVAALGGMVVPALVYLGFRLDQPAERGWAVPMATDIAFVVGVLALFGRRAPLGLKVLLLSLAIVDDLGAVLIIAFVFSDALAWGWLAVAATGFGVTWLFNRSGVRRVGVYVVVGAGIWLAFLKSGVHPTVAGVLLGLLTPQSAWLGEQTLTEVLGDLWNRHAAGATLVEQRAELDLLGFTTREAASPLHRLETALHPWVAFVIMPLFALANAGVPLEPAAITQPVALAVAAGLCVGKPVGVLLACWLAVRLGLASLPAGVSWSLLIGGACLGGIGFTMALFLNALAFANFPSLEAAGKIGTLAGSTASAVVGAVVLLAASRLPPAQGRQSPSPRC